jgi:hypothetical protein
MAHFAKLDSDNIVTEVRVVADDAIKTQANVVSEQKGKQFLNSLRGSAKWVRTFKDGSQRGRYAAVGYKYDATLDAFIRPKPFDSWTLNSSTTDWEAPVSYPTDDKPYLWDEDNTQWVEGK